MKLDDRVVVSSGPFVGAVGRIVHAREATERLAATYLVQFDLGGAFRFTADQLKGEDDATVPAVPKD